MRATPCGWPGGWGSQATPCGWPYYSRSLSDCTAWLPRTPYIVGPPLAGGLRSPPSRPPARGGPTIDDPSSRGATASYIVGPPLAGGLWAGGLWAGGLRALACGWPVVAAGLRALACGWAVGGGPAAGLRA